MSGGALAELNDNMVNNGTILYESAANGFLGTNNGNVISKLGATITIASDNGYYTTEDENVWQGCAGTNWDTGNNWTNGVEPTTTEKAVILAAPSSQPFLNVSANCAALYIETGASITIKDIGQLDIVGDELSVDNNGTITNRGTINITKSSDTEMAFANRSSLVNEGTINITRGSIGLFSPAGSTMNNDEDAEINILNCTTGIELANAVTNNGTMSITGGVTGFLSTGQFRNEEDATITIDGTSTMALYHNSTAFFSNGGELLLGQSAANAGIGIELSNTLV